MYQPYYKVRLAYIFPVEHDQKNMQEKIRDYLEKTLRTSLRIISVAELGLESKLEEERDIKGFGYGKPYFVVFETDEGKREEVRLDRGCGAL